MADKTQFPTAPMPPPRSTVLYPQYQPGAFDEKEGERQDKQINDITARARSGGDLRTAFDLLLDVTNDIRKGRRYFRDQCAAERAECRQWQRRCIAVALGWLATCILAAGVIADYPRLFPPPHGGPPAPAQPQQQQGAPNGNPARP